MYKYKQIELELRIHSFVVQCIRSIFSFSLLYYSFNHHEHVNVSVSVDYVVNLDIPVLEVEIFRLDFAIQFHSLANWGKRASTDEQNNDQRLKEQFRSVIV